MAFQLIYTSAPKLIQAGRTGFGTVARHPALKGSLQEEIERVSQFSRVKGMDDGRVIYSFRILHVRAEKFGVISRIRDSGSDYTGRTNHIAHHIILTEAEMTSAQCTPVDVIMYLIHHSTWLDSWESGPIEFGSESEIDISIIPPTLSLPAQYWHPAKYAALPASARYHESCWIVHDGKTLEGGLPAILLMLGESLLVSSHPWSYAFTTDIQPTERVEEMRWRGVTLGSPMAAQASQSVRPTIDLTNTELLAEPDPKLAFLAEHGKGAEPVHRLIGQARQLVTDENATQALVRAGGGKQKLAGASLKFGTTNPPVAQRTVKPWIFAGMGVAALLLLAIIGFVFYQGGQTQVHLNSLESSLSGGQADMAEAIASANADWVYILGKPDNLEKATQSVNLYMEATALWAQGNTEEALVLFEKAVEELPDGALFSNALRKGFNEHRMEAEILQAVKRINAESIDAALATRDGKPSDIDQVIYWQQDYRKVPGLDAKTVSALQRLKGVKEASSKQLYEFKEAVRSARDAAEVGDKGISQKSVTWINDQVALYAKHILCQPTFDGRVLGPLLNSDLLTSEPQRKGMETIQKVMMGIDAKPDRNRTTETITAALVPFGLTLKDTPGINRSVSVLPVEEAAKPEIKLEVAKKPTSTVKSVLVSSLSALQTQVGALDEGYCQISMADVGNWLSPAQVVPAGKNLVRNFADGVKENLGPTEQGVVAVFQGTADASNWSKAAKILVLAKEESDEDGKLVTLKVTEPLISWDQEKREVTLTEKGKEVVANLVDTEGKPFAYYIKRPSGGRVRIEETVSFADELKRLLDEKTRIENQLKQPEYDQEKIKTRFAQLFSDQGNPFLAFGTKVSEGLSGNSAEGSKKLAEEMKPLLTFNDWLKSETPSKDRDKIIYSQDPGCGTKLPSYFSSVISKVESIYIQAQDSVVRPTLSREFSGDSPKNAFSKVIVALGKITLEQDPKKQKNWDKYVGNLRGLFDKTEIYQSACDEMVDLAGDWKLAANRSVLQQRIAAIDNQLAKITSYKLQDFSIYGEVESSSLRIQFLNQGK